MVATFFYANGGMDWAVVASRAQAERWTMARRQLGTAGPVYARSEAPLDARGVPVFPAYTRAARTLARVEGGRRDWY